MKKIFLTTLFLIIFTLSSSIFAAATSSNADVVTWVQDSNGWQLRFPKSVYNSLDSTEKALCSWAGNSSAGYYYPRRGVMRTPGANGVSEWWYFNDGYWVQTQNPAQPFRGDGAQVGQTLKDAIKGVGTINPNNDYTLTIPFSELKPQLGTDISNNFNVFGIYTTTSVRAAQAKTYLESDNVETFSKYLGWAGYSTTGFTAFIDKLKELLNILIEILSNKGVRVDANAVLSINQNAKVSRTNFFFAILESLFKIIGILFIVYGILLGIGGVIDETGAIQQYCITSTMTGGNLSRTKQPLGNKRIDESLIFRYNYIILAIVMILFGGIMMSTTIRMAITTLFLNVIHAIIGFITG